MQNMDLFAEDQLTASLGTTLKRGRRASHATAGIGESAPLPSPHADPIVAERTVFNEDRTHRITLFRYWDNVDDYALGICMNPSGAAEEVGDPTVDGLVKRARLYWGVGAYYQMNVMTIRGTYSADLDKAGLVNVSENDEWIARLAPRARMVVVGWGNPGHKSGRGPEVAELLRKICDPAKVLCFGKNKNGSPVHPLYQRLDAPLLPYFTE